MDHIDYVLRGVGDGQREEADVGMGLFHRLDDGPAAATGEMDVEQNHIRLPLPDQFDGGVDRVGLPDHFDRPTDLGPDPGPEQVVVVDQEHTNPLAHCRSSWPGTGIVRRTSVPEPGPLTTSTDPP